MKILLNVGDYGLERKELAAAGAIKYQLEKMNTEALAGLNDPAELLRELADTINVNEFDVGTLRIRKSVVDYVKSINPAEVLEHPSEGFQRFLTDCREELERRK